MSNFPTTHRFSSAGFVFAAVMTVSLQGTMLMGFDRIAERGDHSQPATTMLVSAPEERAVVTLERVVVTARRT